MVIALVRSIYVLGFQPVQEDSLRLVGLPDQAVPIVRSFADALEDALPGQVEGIYLVGSLALKDFRPGQSDIDFLAILDPAADLNALPSVHRLVSAAHPNVDCDGIYLSTGELALPPAGKGPSAREGKVVLASGDERHAVTWLTLLRHGITVKGRLPSSEWISADETQAAFHSRQNLISYWLPWLDQRRSLTEFDNWSVAWGCLGVARLHAAIVRNEILSKSAAGHHALQYFPRHQPIIEEALKLREGGPSGYSSTTMRASDLTKFMDDLINSLSR
ncbi:MAG: nucleotidyltransferase domain-containing protein [Devosia sp.]